MKIIEVYKKNEKTIDNIVDIGSISFLLLKDPRIAVVQLMLLGVKQIIEIAPIPEQAKIIAHMTMELVADRFSPLSWITNMKAQAIGYSAGAIATTTILFKQTRTKTREV